MEASTPLLSSKPAWRVRMNHIEGFRFIVLSWIIVYHYLHLPHGDSWQFRLRSGRPLDLFTVISGFITHFVWSTRKVGSPIEFLRKRASGLMFMYYFSSVLALFLRVCNLGAMGTTAGAIMYEYLKFIPTLFGVNVWFSVILPFYDDKELIPQPLYLFAHTCYPENGPLWYIQALAFCWLLYPFFSKVLEAMDGVMKPLALMLFLWILAILPAIAVAAAGSQERWMTFLKVWPPFMLPSFFVGCAACELYKQATYLSSTREYASVYNLAGEALFISIIVAVLVFPASELFRLHGFSLVFGAVLVLLGLSTYFHDSSVTVGLKPLLETSVMGELGSISLCAFTLQGPVCRIFTWILRNGLHEDRWHLNWMSWEEFLVYFAILYSVAYLTSIYLDKPLTAKYFKHE
ncbi:hypothetical protein GUITHDRAFT_146244 [Guillardia theta CCMP2712]|uniref:Acyltransferase 3 domain-containing protein n=1 Tax=Guillardia theta (strain CCMP2712) TaxID=905079 RepID=L1IHS0_GUITC|nr:hypothetical protein GUITHDRAFT_146244 [Guillardia theta CCMP2712]EKX35783.1 hypothetical protein GUITHDRAFT_146244 [Guillardia theta CCMP2712]|eukprot:XP_005822763.1 hypothetical protein GUITHDRAFT_146244 [Guillardia theta CCMP2712]